MFIDFIKKYRSLILIIFIFGLGILNHLNIKYSIYRITQPILVPVANNNLFEKTIVTENDLKMVELPLNSINNDILISKEEIIGKYVSPGNSIYNNELFHKSALINENQFSDTSIVTLNEGEVAFPIKVNNITSYGNSILVGQYLDLYFLTTIDGKDSKKILHGLLIENARVIDVKGPNGEDLEVNDFSNNQVSPDIIIVALNEADLDYARKASVIGELILSPSWKSYNSTEKSSYYDINKLRSFIDSQSISFKNSFNEKGN